MVDTQESVCEDEAGGVLFEEGVWFEELTLGGGGRPGMDLIGGGRRGRSFTPVGRGGRGGSEELLWTDVVFLRAGAGRLDWTGAGLEGPGAGLDGTGLESGDGPVEPRLGALPRRGEVSEAGLDETLGRPLPTFPLWSEPSSPLVVSVLALDLRSSVGLAGRGGVVCPAVGPLSWGVPTLVLGATDGLGGSLG